MKLNAQYIIAFVIVIAIAVAGAVIVTGGKIQLPFFSEWVAEVPVTVTNYWVGGQDISLNGEVTLYNGLTLNGVVFAFPQNWQIEVSSYRNGIMIDRAVKGVIVDWGESEDHVIKVGLGENNFGTIKVNLLGANGVVLDGFEVTI